MLGVKTGLSLDRPERADETGLAHAGDTVDPCRRTQRGVHYLACRLNGGSTDCGAVPPESLAQTETLVCRLDGDSTDCGAVPTESLAQI